jgi:hypothetical protein
MDVKGFVGASWALVLNHATCSDSWFIMKGIIFKHTGSSNDTEPSTFGKNDKLEPLNGIELRMANLGKGPTLGL